MTDLTFIDNACMMGLVFGGLACILAAAEMIINQITKGEKE